MPAVTRFGALAALLPLSFALGGCGSDPVRKQPTDGPHPPTCEPGPSYADPSLAAVEIGTVTARLVDLEGAPAADVLVTVCGVDVCSPPALSNGNGDVAAGLSSALKKPAFKYGDGFEYGRFALLLDPDPDGVDLGTVSLPRLPALGATLGPGTAAASGGVTLELSSNGSVDVDPLPPYDTPSGRAFRAAEFPITDLPGGLDHGAGLEVVFALAPVGATLCPAATLTLPNAAGWAPGTEVELLLEGLEVGQTEGEQPWAPYGEWAVFSDGVVDGSGDFITATDGLPLISNLGVRRK